ncbi:hypothetical protein NQ317_016903 [Molorchus minor]|uniref:PHD-type domain-containing protein n=1 Tax=Molorchus minor TaxID=1323400 RepID=A0ABQ9K4R1_9CUCU|nr:hypothetical protein NQ317_016903 [Molorchus minor]
MENGHYLMGPSSNEDEDTSNKTEKEKRDDWKNLTRTETDINTNTAIAKNAVDVNNSREYVIQIKPRKKSGAVSKKELKQGQFENNMDSFSNFADEKKSDNGSLRIGGRRKATIEKQLAKLNEESRPDSRTSNNGRDQEVFALCVTSKINEDPMKGWLLAGNAVIKVRKSEFLFPHFSCLNGDDMMLKMYPDNTWQCPHCKTCVVCYETSDAGYLTVCSVCADGYHASCHQPRITEKIRNGQKWLCINCQMPDELKINEIQSNIGNSFNQKPTLNGSNDNASSPQTVNRTESPDRGNQSDSQSNKDSDDDNIDPSIPDATHWTADEVYQYFAQYFPEEAKIFKEQEIDGRSLLLLKRIDVLTNLNLKLGPALKIYRHVVKLQVRRDDPRLYWL